MASDKISAGKTEKGLSKTVRIGIALMTFLSLSYLLFDPSEKSFSAEAKIVQITPKRVEVPANLTWLDTGIFIKAGDDVIIRYISGQWSIWMGIDPLTDGNGQSGRLETCHLMPQANLGSLIGRIGNNPSFFVGNEVAFGSSSTGNLFLSINDCENFFQDNGGSLVVDVIVQSVAPPTPRPAQISFTANPDVIVRGQCTTLRWDVENVLSVELDGQGVIGHDSRQICLQATTTYTLRVITDNGDVYRTVTVTVLDPTISPPPTPIQFPTPEPTRPPSPTSEANVPQPIASPPVPRPVPTPAQPKIKMAQAANLRSGPGRTFKIVGGANAGNEFVITAKATTTDGVWWQVYDERQSRLVWVASWLGSASGDTFKVAESPLANKINLVGVNKLENGFCGNIMVFRRPLSAYWQGHVAFAILTNERSFRGSVDGWDDVSLNNKTSEKSYSGFALAQIIEDMKREGYTDFKILPVRSNCNFDAAVKKWENVKSQKYFVLKLNCANGVVDVLTAFGATDLPSLDRLPAPNWWFGSFGSSWRYGESFDY